MKIRHLFYILLLAFAACSKVITPASIERTSHDSISSDSTRYKEHLQKNMVHVDGDSTGLKIVFGCDSMKQAFIRQIEDMKSRGVITQYSFKDNTLYFTTKRTELEQEVYTLQTELERVKKSVVHDYKYIQKPPIIISQTPRFARFTIVWFFVTLALLAGGAIVKFKLYRFFV